MAWHVCPNHGIFCVTGPPEEQEKRESMEFCPVCHAKLIKNGTVSVKKES